MARVKGVFSSKGLFIVVIFLMLVGLILMTRLFTEQNGTESTSESMGVAAIIQSAVSEHFTINPKDLFWRQTLNLLVRKAAHFIEYFFVGIVLCAFLNMLFRRVWIVFPASALTAVVLAFLDEYRQKFIGGRTPTWFDVRIDSYGALLGIIITTVFFIAYFKIKKLKERIILLEDKLAERDEND